jgi:hypothetical protein
MHIRSIDYLSVALTISKPFYKLQAKILDKGKISKQVQEAYVKASASSKARSALRLVIPDETRI